VPVVKPDANGHSLINHHRQAPAAQPEQGLAPVPIRAARCCTGCSFGGATEGHHGRLTALEYDQDALLELMELAVTWPELEYSETHTIPPDSWMAFVESHRWADPDRVERIVSIATDIVMTAKRASQRRLEPSDCHSRQVDDAAPNATGDAAESNVRTPSPRRSRRRSPAKHATTRVMQTANDGGQ
jgi:hypothetical protein